MPPTTAEDLVHGGTSVGAQMEAIGDLDGVRCALLATLRVRAGAVAHDDLDTGVMAQPVGEYLGGAIVEQINRTVGLKIDEQGAITTLLAP